MSAASVLAELDSLLVKLAIPCAGARVSFVVARVGDAQQLITCRCQFSVEKLEARRGFDYGTIRLSESWLTVEEMLNLLRALTEGTGNIDGVAIAGKYGPSFGLRDRKVAPPDGVSGWSEWACDFRREDNASNIDARFRPLVRMGLRPYRTGDQAIAEWVWAVGESWTGSQLPHAEEIAVVVPDARARVTTVEWKPNSLRVVGEFGVSRDEVEMQAVLHLFGGIEHTPACRPDGNSAVEWEIDPSVVRAEVYVVHSSGDLLWFTDVPNTGSKVRTMGQGRTPQEIADRDLADGESDHVEFKPFLVDGDDSAKAREVVKSVVALSNSAGGRLYIGVLDDSTPEGRGRFLKSAGSDPTKAEDTLRARVAKLIADKIKPVPEDHKIDLVLSAGEPVLVVNVKRGANRPYATHENEIYIRKGSTNRRPDPHSELRDLYPEPERNSESLSYLVGLDTTPARGYE
jgi:hypothetical protein